MHMILDQRVIGRSKTEVALSSARDCLRHGLSLPHEHLEALLRHVEGVHRSAEAADRFWRDVQRGARHRQDRSFPVPEDIARRARNQIRAPLGWPPVLAGEDP